MPKNRPQTLSEGDFCIHFKPNQLIITILGSEQFARYLLNK